MKNILWLLAALAVIIFSINSFPAGESNGPNVPTSPYGGGGGNGGGTNNGGRACTMDAKLCPDGSYVGRTGPNCEFECPKITLPKDVATKINQPVGVLGVKITPTEVVSDSRCPIDVTCVWAGEIKVRVIISSGLGDSTSVLGLGDKITTEAEEITLLEASPAPRSTVNIKPEDYSFVFKVAKRQLPY